jgi:DNA recombination protein RmuC
MAFWILSIGGWTFIVILFAHLVCRMVWRRSPCHECVRLRNENESLREELEKYRTAYNTLERDFAVHRARETERLTAMEDRLNFVESARKDMEQIFRGTAAEISQKTMEQLRFHSQADMEKEKATVAAMVAPVKEIIARLDQRIVQSDQRHGQEAVKLDENLRQLFQTQKDLDRETKRLNLALCQSHVRGRWGELQLRRLVEMSGMQEHVDFDEQVTMATGDGANPLRADMVIRLPGGHHIVVDAKTVVDAHMQAMECESSEERAVLLRQHGQNVFDRVQELAKKNYWKFSRKTFEYVVLFLPGDHLYATAVQQRPNLFEEAIARRVLLTSPMNFLALLKTIACTWAQVATNDEAEKIVNLGKTFLERVEVLFRRLGELGTRLRQTVDAYNGTLVTVDSRLWPTLQQFSRLQSIGTGCGDYRPAPIDESVRSLRTPLSRETECTSCEKVVSLTS